ncbi:MAG: hypothetical protein V1870_01360, partial [Candidatus Aenigmatarchaeota archaeon]
HKDALEYNLKNTDKGIWVATSRYVDSNGNHLFAEHYAPKSMHEKAPDGIARKLTIPKQGYPKVVKDGNENILYDCRNNGGVPRETTKDLEEARALAKEAGFDPRIVSFVDIDLSYDGWAPIVCCSDSGGGPAGIIDVWNFGGFDIRDGILGCVLAGGSEQNASRMKQEHFAKAENSREIVISTPEEAEQYAKALAEYTRSLK